MEKYGIVGKNIGYALSPVLHKIIFKKIGVDANYEIYDGKSSENDGEFLKGILKRIKSGEIKGVSVTIPYKEKIMQYLEETDIKALSIGAVNTVVLEKGKLKGYNTDYYGIVESIEKLGVTIENEEVYILGTGGAAKAVINVIDELGGTPVLVSRSRTELKLGNKKYSVIDYETLKNIKKGKLLIDTTPTCLLKETVNKFEYIFQLKYLNESDNELCIDSDYRADNYIDGSYMLVVQGIKAEEIWQTKKIDAFEEIYVEFLANKTSKKD